MGSFRMGTGLPWFGENGPQGPRATLSRGPDRSGPCGPRCHSTPMRPLTVGCLASSHRNLRDTVASCFPPSIPEPDGAREVDVKATQFQTETLPAPLSPVSPNDLADALAFALRFSGRKCVHNGDEFMAQIVAKRLVEHLERSGFVVMRKPPAVRASTPGRGYEGS